MKEAVVLIDNGYLSKISKHFGGGKYLKIDISQFAIDMAKSQGFWCKEIYFYTAPPFQSSPSTKEEDERKANYDKFVAKLRKLNIVVREGRLQKINSTYKQKGVDTLLTMDLMSISKSKEKRTIILLACDTDFVPILNQARADGNEVILFYFSDYKRKSSFSMSNYILTACDKSVLLTKKFFEKT